MVGVRTPQISTHTHVCIYIRVLCVLWAWRDCMCSTYVTLTRTCARARARALMCVCVCVCRVFIGTCTWAGVYGVESWGTVVTSRKPGSISRHAITTLDSPSSSVLPSLFLPPLPRSPLCHTQTRRSVYFSLLPFTPSPGRLMDPPGCLRWWERTSLLASEGQRFFSSATLFAAIMSRDRIMSLRLTEQYAKNSSGVCKRVVSNFEYEHTRGITNTFRRKYQQKLEGTLLSRKIIKIAIYTYDIYIWYVHIKFLFYMQKDNSFVFCFDVRKITIRCSLVLSILESSNFFSFYIKVTPTQLNLILLSTQQCFQCRYLYLKIQLLFIYINFILFCVL